MGNAFAVDEEPQNLERILNSKVMNSNNTKSFSGFVFAWRMYQDENIKEEALPLSKFEKFEDDNCYILAFVIRWQEISFLDETQIALFKRVIAAAQTFSSSSVGSNVIFDEYSSFFQEDISHPTHYFLYSGRGQSSQPILKAFTLALVHKLDKLLREPTALNIIMKSPKSFSELAHADRIASTFLENARPLKMEKTIAVFRRLAMVPTKWNFPESRSVQFAHRKISDEVTIMNSASESFASWSSADLLRHFDPICSQILDFIYLGGKTVADDKYVLKQNNISHILNCAGSVCANKFPEEFTYKTFYLLDGVHQEISSLFYEVIDFCEQARETSGKIFIHCQQGVSRSSALAICYLMWLHRWNFEKAFEFLKERRSVCSPNAGFITQLMLWWKRTQEPLVKKYRVYKVGPHSSDRTLLVAKLETMNGASRSKASLDSKTCFVLHSAENLILWEGKSCPNENVQVGKKFIRQLQKYEKASPNVIECKEGNEPSFFSDIIII